MKSKLQALYLSWKKHWAIIKLRKTFIILFLLFAAVQQAQSQKDLTRILFIFDASNSMNGKWEGSTRLEVAKRLLASTVDSLRGIPNLEIGLRIYGHQSPVTATFQDCNDGLGYLKRKKISKNSQTFFHFERYSVNGKIWEKYITLEGKRDGEVLIFDENGQLVDTPPDPLKKKKINAKHIEISVPKKEIDPDAGGPKKGKVEFRTDKSDNLHEPVGKVKFEPEKLRENNLSIIYSVKRMKPAASKGQYMRNMVISSTMGPGVKIDIASLNE